MKVQVSILMLIACLGIKTSAAETAPVPEMLPPVPPSPIEDFRRWLQMPEGEREKALADYSPNKQEVLRRKLKAYAAMPREQRDSRLRALELRWYLQPLMSRPAALRGNYLDLIPARLHEAITGRLEHWDSLSEETRREILADEHKRELATGYFAQVRRSSTNLPPAPRLMPPHPADLDKHLNHWGNASAAGRERMTGHLATFFGMSLDEQQRALARLSASERQEMQKTLEAFGRLSPQDRQECLESFQRLATMTPQERASFLRNAARWLQLSPDERAAWREMVVKLPPMPPEPVPEAPMPRGSVGTRDKMAGAPSYSPVFN